MQLTPLVCCVNPINISWSCFLQGKGCCQLCLAAAPARAENIPFPSTGGQHPAAPPPAPPFPFRSCISEYCFAFQGCALPTWAKSCEDPSGLNPNSDYFCSQMPKPAHSGGARCHGPTLGSPGAAHPPTPGQVPQPTGGGSGRSAAPRGPPQLSVQQRAAIVAPAAAQGPSRPHPAPRIPARFRAQQEPRVRFAGEVAFWSAKTALLQQKKGSAANPPAPGRLTGAAATPRARGSLPPPP